MIIALDNRHARVVSATPEEREFLRGYLSFPDVKARWTGKAPEDAVHKLYEEITQTFPSGFLASVVKAAGRDFKIDVVDNRVAPCARDVDADLAWLRSYQKDAVDAVAAKLRGIIGHPTAAGKGEVVVGLTRALPCEWLCLAPNLTLVNNVADRFLKRNREHGIDLGEPGRIGEGKWSEGLRLTCGTYQSIYAALGSARCKALLARVGGLVCDEGHTIPAVTFMQATRECSAYYRVGLSATPLQREDMRSAITIGVIGPVIHKRTPGELIASGDISRARVRFTTMSHRDPDGWTYAEVYRELVVESPARNALLTDLAKKAEKPAFLFVKLIEHGKALEKMLWAAGVKARFVWGDHNAYQIEQAIKELTRGAIDVLITSAKLKQGVDVPSLRSVILGSSGASVIDTLQKLGRGSRIERDAAGNVKKDEFTLYDVYDVGNQWLEKHSKARKRAMLAEGYEVIVTGEVPRVAAARARKEAFTWKMGD